MKEESKGDAGLQPEVNPLERRSANSRRENPNRKGRRSVCRNGNKVRGRVERARALTQLEAATNGGEAPHRGGVEVKRNFRARGVATG